MLYVMLEYPLLVLLWVETDTISMVGLLYALEFYTCYCIH